MKGLEDKIKEITGTKLYYHDPNDTDCVTPLRVPNLDHQYCEALAKEIKGIAIEFSARMSHDYECNSSTVEEMWEAFIKERYKP